MYVLLYDLHFDDGMATLDGLKSLPLLHLSFNLLQSCQKDHVISFGILRIRVPQFLTCIFEF